jgi:hypothetical protein
MAESIFHTHLLRKIIISHLWIGKKQPLLPHNAEFEYGSAEVKEATAKKLNTIAKALQDRPGIKLDVEGHVDMEKGREALKTLFFQRKIKTQKMKETAKGPGPVPVDEIKVRPKEYERYLKKAYKEEKFRNRKISSASKRASRFRRWKN